MRIKYMDKKEKFIILGLIALIIIAIMAKFYIDKKEPIINEAELDFDENTIEADMAPVANELICHITGGVNNPGIYELKAGDRIFHLVEAAGGLVENADENRINLAKRLEDEEKIHIPIIGEETTEELIIETGSTSEGDSLININTCTKEELMSLSGIGDKTADKIINYREDTKFNSIEEIMNVSGIGDKKFQAIKDFIKVK